MGAVGWFGGEIIGALYRRLISPDPAQDHARVFATPGNAFACSREFPTVAETPAGGIKRVTELTSTTSRGDRTGRSSTP
jgi:hypothetical protein